MKSKEANRGDSGVTKLDITWPSWYASVDCMTNLHKQNSSQPSDLSQWMLIVWGYKWLIFTWLFFSH